MIYFLGTRSNSSSEVMDAQGQWPSSILLLRVWEW